MSRKETVVLSPRMPGSFSSGRATPAAQAGPGREVIPSNPPEDPPAPATRSMNMGLGPALHLRGSTPDGGGRARLSSVGVGQRDLQSLVRPGSGWRGHPTEL